MTADPLEGMEIERIAAVTALVLLQGMLGRKVKVELNDYSEFFGCGFGGILKRVDTVPSRESGAISVCMEDETDFFLDPANCMIYLVDLDGTEAIEFHRPVGPVIAIHAVGP